MGSCNWRYRARPEPAGFLLREPRTTGRCTHLGNDTLCATWNPYAMGNELDDHDGLDRSMRWLACEVIPLVTLRFLPPRVQHYWLPEAQRRRVPDRYSFLERWTIFLNHVIVPLHRSPRLPLQLMQGNCPEHHDCQRVERSYRVRDGCTGLDGRALFFTLGSPHCPGCGSAHPSSVSSSASWVVEPPQLARFMFPEIRELYRWRLPRSVQRNARPPRFRPIHGKQRG